MYYETDASVEMGGKITLKSALIADVLDPNVKTSFSVISPSGAYAKATDGSILDSSADYSKEYIIIPSEYGRYTITYTAKDTLNAIQEIEYTVLVYDVESPKIILDGVTFDGSVSVTKIEQYAKKGTTITVKDVEVVDNCSANIKVYSLYKTPSGVLRMLGEDKTIALDLPGEYMVYYVASDEEGNSTTASYVIYSEE